MRMFMGFVWFFIFLLFLSGLVGVFAGFYAPRSGLPPEQWDALGKKIGERSTPFVLFAAVALSALGTELQVLPGTKKREKNSSGT
jgi:hypothetical protein